MLLNVSNSAHKWDAFHIGMFMMASCGMSWLLLIFALIAPPNLLIFPFSLVGLPISTILLIAASVAPGLAASVCFSEVRTALLTFRASPALVTGVFIVAAALPFTAQLGCEDTGPWWDRRTGWDFTRVFLLNFCLSPLWEEIAWRAVFYQKVRSSIGPRWGMILAALGWAIWHLGFLGYLYKNRIPGNVLMYVPIQYFCIGMILCMIYEIAGGALTPCVVFHSSFNASVSAYFRGNGRAMNGNCYLVETVAIVLLSAGLYVVVNQRKLIKQNC